MINLTFKDVGQGDSIIISWEINSVKKIGVIDCHKYGGGNLIIEELERIDGKYEIEFIILTHGHKDHYSGIIGLLKFCKKEGISIKNFSSTLQPSQFQFLESTRSIGELKAINSLLDTIHLFYDQGIILDLFPIYNKVTHFIIGGFRLECIFPRQSDYTKLGNKLDKFVNKKIKTKPDLNQISTIFKLRNDTFYALLTSDCVVESLNYAERVDNDLQTKEIKLAQVPHHGSKKNHNITFWRNRIRQEKCPAIFSVGDSIHNLPDEEVVNSFVEMDYEIYSTSNVNGIKSFLVNGKTLQDYSYALDLFSSSQATYQLQFNNNQFIGDKVFLISPSELQYKPL